MSDLPAEVFADIFSRLPVKTLLRFRCVSKCWCALIDSPYFIKSHLKRSIETKNNLSLILEADDIYSLDFETLDKAVKLDHPLKKESYGTQVLGSCNGLLCLSNTDEGIVLWNPSTRKQRKLPVPSIKFPDEFCIFQSILYGFGYDVVNDDYKLVRMVQFSGSSVYSEYKIYSLKLNSWRRLPDFPYDLRCTGMNGMLASGALHWIVTPKPLDTANLIVAFDIRIEEYRLVPQPEYSDNYFYMFIGVIGEYFGILCNYFLVHCMDIWVMKEYGVKESWTKLFSVAQPSIIRSLHYKRPIAYSKSGKEVLWQQDNKEFFWYDLEKKTVKNITIRDKPGFLLAADICLESLVLLSGEGGSDGQAAGTREEKEKEEEVTQVTQH